MVNEVEVGLDILGLLLAMIGDSDWETESATRIATYLNQCIRPSWPRRRNRFNGLCFRISDS